MAPRAWLPGLVPAVLAALIVAVSACGSSAGSNSSPPTTIERPNFTDLKDLVVTVDGRATPLGDSGLRYLRWNARAFDDPATPGFDGIVGAIRKYLACKEDTWSIGGQTFTVDLIVQGINEGDRSLVEQGLRGVDWGVARTIHGDGNYTLTRACDGKTAESLGGTHTGAQWLESLGRTVYLLRSSPWTDDYRPKIETYIARMEKIARLQLKEENWTYWETHWLVDDDGQMFTHKTYLMAAGLGLTATLTDNRAEASVWAAAAARIARRGMNAQRENGVNPEKGGYDVSYQMYGTWLAEVYSSTLPSGDFEVELGRKIDRSLQWMSGRVDDHTGRVDIGDSTRTCVPSNPNYDAADAVRVFLTWGLLHRDRPELIDRAILIDQGAKGPGNPCP